MLSSFIQYQNALQTLRLLSPAIPFLVLIGYSLMQLPGPKPKSAGLLAQMNLVKSPPFTPDDGAWLQQEVVKFTVNAPWLPPPLGQGVAMSSPSLPDHNSADLVCGAVA